MTNLEELTSPIEYITTIPFDPFNLRPIPGVIAAHQYVYYTRYPWTNNLQLFFDVLSAFSCDSPEAEQYFMFSLGPDYFCDYCVGPYQPKGILTYDPTNGTVSRGEVATFGP